MHWGDEGRWYEVQGGRRRWVSDCGWSSELRPAASRGEAHPRPSGGRSSEWEGVWVIGWRVCVILMRGEGPFVGGVHCEGL